LYVLLEPKRQRDMIVSLLKIAEQGGWLPKWAWSEGYTGGMLGDHSVSVIVDSYVKGIRNFDVNKAYEAMYKNATEQLVGVPWTRRGLYKYMELGYAPEDAGITKSLVSATHAYGPGGATDTGYYPEVSGSVSATLEYAYNDWCVAEMARILGRSEDAEYFRKRAFNYKNVYDPSVGFMRPRNIDGSWAMDPFGPTISGKHSQFYCEGNAWTYSWFVPHDIEGLVNLMEGRDNFNSKLDSAFLGLEARQSFYDPENEPNIHYPYLFNYTGAPWKTQQIIRHITENIFTADHENGLPGDDDVGTMSAWYIFSAMGFYPVLPGSDQYVIGSPLFDEVKIFLDEEYYNGKVLHIKSANNSSKNKYIQSVKLNGEDYNKTWISHEDLVNNGRLVFNMGDSPNKNWGIGEDAVPMSMTTHSPHFVFSDLIAPENALPDDYVNVQVTVTNKGSLGTALVRLYQSDRNIHFRMQHPMGEERIVLDPGESKVVQFNVPIYYHGVNTLQVDTLSTPIRVPRPDFRKLYYADEKNQYERKTVNFLKERGPNQN
jgi:predicted alpha-1,2-mannosidase